MPDLDGRACRREVWRGGHEEDAAAVKLRRGGRTIEKRACLRSAIEVNLAETVPGIEDHEVGLGFLERELTAESGVRRGHRTRRGSTQETRRAGSPRRPAKRG